MQNDMLATASRLLIWAIMGFIIIGQQACMYLLCRNLKAQLKMIEILIINTVSTRIALKLFQHFVFGPFSLF